MSSTMKATEAVITGIGSYMNLFEPRGFGNNEPKYSVCMVFSKKDTKQLARLQKAIKAAQEEARTKVWGGQIPAKVSLPIHDGDVDKANDPFYHGKYYVNCSNREQPGVVDQSVQPIMDRQMIYSGCVVNAHCNFYGYKNSGNSGISCSLQNVQLVADGERLSGRKPASAAFNAVTQEDLDEIDAFLSDSENLPEFFK